MENPDWTASGEALTTFILDVFRLNGRLLVAGDRLVSELGLTSARWQVLGAISYAQQPESVARLARNMGVHRQGIQRIVNELEKEGIVEFRPNPHHKRAQLVVLTSKGQELFAKALELQIPWANALSKGLKSKDIEAARHIADVLATRLENESENTSGNK